MLNSRGALLRNAERDEHRNQDRDERAHAEPALHARSALLTVGKCAVCLGDAWSTSPRPRVGDVLAHCCGRGVAVPRDDRLEHGAVLV